MNFYKTKQNKTKQVKPICLWFTILLACLIFTNCQKDDDIQNTAITEEKVDRPVTVSTIPQNQFIGNNKVWSKIGALKTELAEFSKRSQNRTVHSNETGLSIDTDFATYIEFENGYHSYTFLVTNTPSGEGLQNILLSLQDDGSYKEFLIHYNITDEEIAQLDNGEQVNLESRYTMTEIEGGFSDQLFSKILYQDDCTLMEYIPDTCSGPGSGGHTFGSEPPCRFINDNDPLTFPPTDSGTIVVTTFVCNTGGPSGGGAPSDGGTPPPYNPGNGHGSNGTGSGSNGNTTSPTTSCKGKCVPIGDIDFACTGTEPFTGPSANLDLLPGEICFLLNNPPQKDLVDAYLSEDGSSDFARIAVSIIYESDDIYFDVIIYVLENEQDYRNKMSEDELALYDTLSNIQQVKYLASAKQALDKTDELFVTNCEKINGKGDSFRHAYWNALSSSRIGVGLTNLLTTRHENKPSTYPYNDKENEMDLFNNQIGRDVFINGSTNIFEDVQDSLINGELRYLINQDSNCLATFSSQLTPTNQ